MVEKKKHFKVYLKNILDPKSGFLGKAFPSVSAFRWKEKERNDFYKICHVGFSLFIYFFYKKTLLKKYVFSYNLMIIIIQFLK